MIIFFMFRLFSDFKNRYSFSLRLFFQNNLKLEYKNLLQSKIVGRHDFSYKTAILDFYQF